MSRALYRTYRSKSLDDIVGQTHITSILKKALASQKVSHAYLFTGPRGVGKTSIARILAHEINNLPYGDTGEHLDIIEIDAASNNGVDDVRLLREKAQIAPVSAAKKIYIIDEVHMLSKPAFNALLKTLEEPPEHVVFILATTDVDKLPPTIISRTQRYAFRAISKEDIVSHLRHIATEEKITITDDALELIAERGDGSFRDSISMLDQLSSLTDDTGGITAELVESTLGLAPTTRIHDLLEAVSNHDIKAIAELITNTESEGIGALVLCDQLTRTVQKLAPEKPELLALLDALLDVPRSSLPYSKLLSVLGTFALQSKPKKSAPLLAPVMEVTATIEELSRQATKKHPKLPTPTGNTSSPDTLVEKVLDKPVSTVQQTSKKKAKPEDIKPFNWQALLSHVHDTSVAVYTVLSKCEHEFANDELTLFTVNAFYKKKIDDPKYLTHLYASLKETCGYQPTIHTVPTRAPLKNGTVAAIADIMGGGIEVSPEAVA